MGYLDSNRNFVSELAPGELAEYKIRAAWLAQRWFTSRTIESFDLGNLPSGYMTAEISTSYRPSQRRIWFYVDNRLVYIMRVESGQGLRRQAQDFYSMELNRQRMHQQLPERV